MIINKITKSIEVRGDLPNSNWMGEGWYIVKDGSDLAIKIENLYPRFDFVTDENDTLIDVVEIPKTKEEEILDKIDEIDTELKKIDSDGVNRHLENQIEASKTYNTIYENTRLLIDRKKELREEREELTLRLKDLRDEDE